jgi:hypothetical protein
VRELAGGGVEHRTNWIIEHKGRSYPRPENTLSSKVGVSKRLEVSECAALILLNGFFATADGRHVIYNGAYPHLREIILEYLGCPNNRKLIARETAKHNAADLENELSQRGACVAIVRERSDWACHEQGRYLANVPVVELVKVADSDPVPLPKGRRILSGIKTLDLTKVIAGPTAGRQFAEHGADVIHIHHPYEDLVYAMDIDTSYGKTNAYLDFSRDLDRQILTNLIRDADIFLDGYRYGALEKQGFGLDDVVRINKNVISVGLDAYGFGGPWARRRGDEQRLQVLAFQHFLRLASDAAARLVQFGVVLCSPVAHTLRPNYEYVLRRASAVKERPLLCWSFWTPSPNWNAVLKRVAETGMRRARKLSRRSGKTEHIYGEVLYKAGKWPGMRRVIIKAEVVRAADKDAKDNPRFVITNMKTESTVDLRACLLPAR